MFKTAQHHHALGADLQDLLLEDEGEEKVAVIVGAISGGYGGSQGKRQARRILRERGLSEGEIADVEDSDRVRTTGRAVASGVGYQLLGNVAGGIVGGLPGAVAGGLLGAGYGYHRNESKLRRDMLDEADRIRGGRSRRSRRELRESRRSLRESRRALRYRD
jgi:hypothetical protein